MQYRPESKDILQAIQDLLMKDILPKIEGDELLSYKTLVSWNMLGVVIREAEKEEVNLIDEFNSFQKISSLQNQISYSETDFRALSKKEKTKTVQELNKTLALSIRTTKNSEIHSAEWHHIKSTLKNNLEISNPRFNV